MRVGIRAVGRMRNGPEKELAGRYLDRFARLGFSLGLGFTGVDELPESRADTVDARKADEAARLLANLPAGGAVVVLDEHGKSIASETLAKRIGGWRDEGRNIVFMIGGPDGHDPSLRARADLVLSFGAQTWPHQMVRIMLAEQLYRAATILAGHPYHRE